MKKVLTIAGSDTSGGAGIQADLKTFEERNTYGMSAITVIVAMDPDQAWSHQIFPIPMDTINSPSRSWSRCAQNRYATNR
jgi:pyridoxine kinase